MRGRNFNSVRFCLWGPVGKKYRSWDCMGVIQGPPCGQVVACVTKSSRSRLLQVPFAHSWSMRSGRAKVQPTWCGTTRLTLTGGLGGGGPAYRASADFVPSGPVGKSVRGIAKTGPRAGGQKMQYCQGRGPPPLENDLIPGRGV